MNTKPLIWASTLTAAVLAYSSVATNEPLRREAEPKNEDLRCKQQPKKNEELLKFVQGRWRMVDEWLREWPNRKRIVKTPDNGRIEVTFRDREGRVIKISEDGRQWRLQYLFVLDPDSDPMGCDQYTDGRVQKLMTYGVLQVKENHLHIGLALYEGKRPKSCDIWKDESCSALAVFKRVRRPIQDAIDGIDAFFRRLEESIEKQPQLPEP